MELLEYFSAHCFSITASLSPDFSFYARVMFLKDVTQIKHKIPQFKTVHFLGLRGLKTSSYIVCDYTNSGHMDL
jgi:hypothetical protein